MKALSLRQPWAWLVVHGGKHVENRGWNTKFRGDFLIHAAKGMTVEEYDSAFLFAQDVYTRLGRSVVLPPIPELARGGIIGRARLVDVVPPCADACPHPWHMAGQYGFLLEDVRPLPFIPWRGSLNFFEIPDAKLPEPLRRSA